MARKTREDFERERQARARSDLVKAGIATRGRHAEAAAEAEIERLRALSNAPTEEAPSPAPFRFSGTFVILVGICIIGFLLIFSTP